MMEIFWGTIPTLYIHSIPSVPFHCHSQSNYTGQYTARRVHRPTGTPAHRPPVSTIFTTKSANRDRQPCFQWKSPGHQKGDTWLGSFHDAERAYLMRTHSGWDEPFFIETKPHGYIWAYLSRLMKGCLNPSRKHCLSA